MLYTVANMHVEVPCLVVGIFNHDLGVSVIVALGVFCRSYTIIVDRIPRRVAGLSLISVRNPNASDSIHQ